MKKVRLEKENKRREKRARKKKNNNINLIDDFNLIFKCQTKGRFHAIIGTQMDILECTHASPISHIFSLTQFFIYLFKIIK